MVLFHIIYLIEIFILNNMKISELIQFNKLQPTTESKELQEHLINFENDNNNNTDFIDYIHNKNESLLHFLYDVLCTDDQKTNNKYIDNSINQYAGKQFRVGPIIGIHNDGYRQFIYNNNMKHQHHYNFNQFNATTYFKSVSTTSNFIKFQQQIDHNVLNKIYLTNYEYLNLLQIINNTQNKTYYLEYNQSSFPILQIILTKNNKTNRSQRKTIIVGTKIKFEVLIQNDFYLKLEEKEKSFYHQFCRHFTQIIRNEYIEMGHHHHAYCYRTKFLPYKYTSSTQLSTIKNHHYIDYTPNHPIVSIQNYYKIFNKRQILQQQQSISPPCISSSILSSSLSPNKKHKIFLGINTSKNLVSNEWKSMVYNGVLDWFANAPKKYGELHESSNRIKSWLWYGYNWNKNGTHRSQLSKALKSCDGLYKLLNQNTPSFVRSALNYIQSTTFIPTTITINQISINLYYNSSSTSIRYVSLDPHKEYKKFKYIGQVSINSDDIECWLSFNLKSNHHNGDLKVLIEDKSGLELIGMCFILFILFILFMMIFCRFFYIHSTIMGRNNSNTFNK